MKQKYSSKNTSINKTKLPIIYSKINWEKLREEWSKKHNTKPIVLDYGCGRYTEHIQKFVENLGFEYVGYDPYWASEVDHKKLNPAVIVCSNVLNVIQENWMIKRIMKHLYRHGVPYFITVYEGDKSGKGRATSDTSYQRNATLHTYAEIVKWEMAIRKHVLTLECYTQYIK